MGEACPLWASAWLQPVAQTYQLVDIIVSPVTVKGDCRGVGEGRLLEPRLPWMGPIGRGAPYQRGRPAPPRPSLQPCALLCPAQVRLGRWVTALGEQAGLMRTWGSPEQDDSCNALEMPPPSPPSPAGRVAPLVAGPSPISENKVSAIATWLSELRAWCQPRPGTLRRGLGPQPTCLPWGRCCSL